MDTTCFVLLVLAALSATSVGQSETTTPVTTTVSPTTPAPMKESSNEVAETSPEERFVGNLAKDSTTTATPTVPLELSSEGTPGSPPSAEGGSSTDSRNAISSVHENDKLNDINNEKLPSKQGQLENEGSASTEASLGTTWHTTVSHEDSSGDVVTASGTRESTGSVTTATVTEEPEEPSLAVLSTPTNASGDANTRDSPVPLATTALPTLTPEVTSPGSSFTETPTSNEALNPENANSEAELYPGRFTISATEQQNSTDTTAEYTDSRVTEGAPNTTPVITSNPTFSLDTDPTAVVTDVGTPVITIDYNPLGTNNAYSQGLMGGIPSGLTGYFGEHHDTTPVITTHATTVDHVQHGDAANTPPSAGETSSALTDSYGTLTTLPGYNTESQSQATTSEAPLSLAPSGKTVEDDLQAEVDSGSASISPGGTALVTEPPSDSTPTSGTHLSDATEPSYSANAAGTNYPTESTDTTTSRPLEESFPSEGDARATTEMAVSDGGSPFTTSESTPTTQHSANTAKMGRSHDLEGTDVATHDANKTTTSPTTTTPADGVTSYSTKEGKTTKPEHETSTLPSFVSSAETTRSETTTTASPSESDSPVTTKRLDPEATTVSVTDSVSNEPVDLYTSASPDNTQPATFAEAKETAEDATTASTTSAPVDATTAVSSDTTVTDATASEERTEVKTSETPPSAADEQTEALTPPEETVDLPQQGGAEGTTNEGTTAPADLSTQEGTRVFEGSRTDQYSETVPAFSAQSTTQSPDVSLTEETPVHYATEEPTGTSGPSEGQNTETVESKSSVESATLEPTPAPTTQQSTEVPTESSSAATNGVEIIARTEAATEEAAEMQTTDVPVTNEPIETSQTSIEHLTTAQPSFETTGPVTYEPPTTTVSPESWSPEGSHPTSKAENEATEQPTSSVSDSGIFGASSASRSPKQLSESTPVDFPDETTPPFIEHDHKHSFTTAPDLFSTTQAHTLWRQSATDSISTQEASTQGSTEQAPWSRPATTAATVQEWGTTTDRRVSATGSTNGEEETVATPADASCGIVDGSVPVSCLLPDELNNTVTVKFADLNRTRAETFRTEAKIWLQDYYRKKGMLLTDPEVVFLSGDRGMDLISFFVVNRTRGSVVPSDGVVAVLNNMKATFEDKLGTVITDVFYGLPVVQKKGVGMAGFLGSQLGLVYVIVGASLAALLLLALLVVIMVKCRTLSSNQYSPDAEKLTKDLQMRAEMGDLRPGEEILKEESQLKEALNGNGTHINGDGWVVPYSQIVSEHKSPADAQDTRL